MAATGVRRARVFAVNLHVAARSACGGALRPVEARDATGWLTRSTKRQLPRKSLGALKTAHGKGFATEASLRAREYGYSNVGFKTLISFIDLRNTASRAVAERLGAKYERTAMLFGSEAGIFRHPPPE